MGKGGGGGAPTQQTVTQTNLPEYARPYFENIMNRAQAQSYQQYVPYENERIAYFTPGQLQTQREVMGMQDPSQFYDASNIAYNSAMQAMQAGQNYKPGQFGSQMGPAERVYSQGIYAPNIQAAQTTYNPQLQNIFAADPQQVSARNIQAAQTTYNPQLQNIYAQRVADVYAPELSGFRDVNAPELSGFRDVTAERVGSRDIQAAQSGYRPELRDILAGGPERVSTDRLSAAQLGGPEEFTAQTAQQYMSPYMQNVVDVQKREALRDAQIAQLGQNLGAARQGTYGGARQALLTGERERGLRTQLGDIQATGSEKAFGQAQQQFERDRAAQIQVGLANLTNEQQARVLSESNRLQSMGMNQDAALKTALANQQSGLQTQQLKTQTELQVEMANLNNQQQARVQNEANRLQAAGMNQQAALQAALANQRGDLETQQLGAQTAMQAALANQQGDLSTQQLGAQTALQAALANQQAGLQTNLADQQSRLATQQLKTQTGLQTALANLNNRQQAAVQNEANRLQAQGMNQDAALKTALANQQSQLSTQQLQTQTGLQTALANLNNRQQAAVQNAANRLQAQGMTADNALRAALANQQAGLTVGQQNLQARLQAQQMGEQSRQFGANLGLQGLQQAMAGAQTLGGLGTAQQDAQLRRLQAQGAVGAEQRGYQQQLLDQAYGDFLRQRDYPMEQLGYFSNLMRGIPVGLSSTQTAYAAPPSVASQLTGAGLSGLALSRLMG